MTKAHLQARITQLEAEVARLNAQVEELKPSPKKWWENLGKNPLTAREFDDYTRIMRQLKDADRELPKSPALTRLHRSHKSLISQLRKLGKFKSNLAAAEFAHNNFQR